MLQERGFTCVEEVARQILREQNRIGGDATHWGDRKKFLELMLSHSIEAYQKVIQHDVVFFDRGIPELVGYCDFIGIDVPQRLADAVARYPYNSKVFIMPPWREIYTTDAERKQDFQEAVTTFERISMSYEQQGYQGVEVPLGSVAQRVDFILQSVA